MLAVPVGKRRNAALAISAILLILAVAQFTGYFTKTISLGVNVAASVQGDISIIEVPSHVTQYEPANLSFSLSNMGSLALSGRVRVEVRDSTNSTSDSFSSGLYSLEPGSYITYTAQWYPDINLGNYTLYVWDNETSPTDMDSVNLSVRCTPGEYRCFGSQLRVCSSGTSWSLVSECTHGCQAGACNPEPEDTGGGGGVSAIPSMPHSMNTDYVEPEVSAGGNYTHTIRVTNNGTSALTNISLEAWSDELGIRVPAIEVGILETGQAATFIIDLGVPDMEPGQYQVGFRVISDQLTREGRIIVTLVPGEEGFVEQCSDSIERYFSTLDSLDMDVRSAEIRGYEMEGVRELLRDAMEELDVMRDLRERGLHEECSLRTDILRRKIEQAVMAYSIAISRPVSIISYPWLEHTIMLFTIIALVVVIVALVGWRRIMSWYDRHRLRMPDRW